MAGETNNKQTSKIVISARRKIGCSAGGQGWGSLRGGAIGAEPKGEKAARLAKACSLARLCLLPGAPFLHLSVLNSYSRF